MKVHVHMTTGKRKRAIALHKTKITAINDQNINNSIKLKKKKLYFNVGGVHFP